MGQDAEIKLYEYGTGVNGFSKLAYENDVTCLENYVTYLYGTWVIFVSQTKKIIMVVKKVIEIMASSPKSWEDATGIAVKTAGKTVKGIKSVYVHHMSAVVKDNKIAEYRINAKITFDVLNE